MIHTDAAASIRVTDLQRDRAVEFLQQAYADGSVTPELFEDRLGQALTAETRAELNASLRGIARLAPTPTPSLAAPFARPGFPDSVQNIAAGVTHASGLCTSVIGPALVKAVATPQSRLWLEASRALAWQSSMLLLLGVGIVGVVFGIEAFLVLGGVAWLLGTIALAARAISGQNSTARIEALLPVKPETERMRLAR